MSQNYDPEILDDTEQGPSIIDQIKVLHGWSVVVGAVVGIVIGLILGADA